jgi:hypothetical protein
MTEIDLRWQLRQLPREIEPGRDLWPGIAAAIEHRPERRASRQAWTWMAMAASVVLAAGLFWKVQPEDSTQPGPSSSARIVASESHAITHEYQAALRQYKGAPIPASLQPSLGELDKSVAQIQRAIAADPKSVFLLDQLRKTYSRRLELTQRAVTG